MEQNNASENLFELQIDAQSNRYLMQTAKWAKFLSIVGFVFCGLLVVWSLFAGVVMNSVSNRFGAETGTAFGPTAGIGTAFFFFFAVVGAILYFFPCLFLFRFAAKMQTALRNNDQNFLTNSFGNLKSFYKFIGILTIIGLAIFLLEILFVMIFAVTSR